MGELTNKNIRRANEPHEANSRVELVIGGQVFSLGPNDAIELTHITHGPLGRRKRFKLKASHRGPYTTKEE